MWSSAARIGLSKLGSSASTRPWRALSSGGVPPVGEGGLEFQTKKYTSFWSNLKQQKQGLGNMALSASIAFLAISLIKQEKELTRANESVGLLRKENEAIAKRLEGVRSVLGEFGAGEKTEDEYRAILRDVFDYIEGRVGSPAETDKAVQRTSTSKFMV